MQEVARKPDEERVPYEPCPVEVIYDFPEIRFKKTGLIYQESITEKQQQFSENPSKFRAVQAMIGAGKSAMATIEALRHSWFYRSNFGFIIRKTIPQANISAIPDLMDVCPRWMIVSWNKTEKTLELLNQYGYEFLQEGGRHLKKNQRYDMLQEIGGTSLLVFTSFEGTVEALEKWASSNLGWYFIDQAEQANPDIYVKLNERMRRMPAARQAWFIANFSRDIPQTAGWLYRYFSEESEDYRENHWYNDDMPTDANKANLPPDYQESLKQTMHPDDYARLVSGDKSQMRMSKTVFTEFSQDVHVIPHRDPPQHWYRGIGLDPGLSNPTAFVEAAFSPNGDAYIYNEYEEADRSVSQIARLLKNIITPQHIFFFIDSTAQNRNQITLTTIQGEFIAWGVPFMLAPKEVIPGVQRMKEYYAYDPNRTHPFTGKRGAARTLISARCPRFIRATQLYRWDENKTHTTLTNEPEAVRKYKDHLVDAWRFLLMGATLPIGLNTPMSAHIPERAQEKSKAITTLQFDSQGRLDFSQMRQFAKLPAPKNPEKSMRERQQPRTVYSRGVTNYAA